MRYNTMPDHSQQLVEIYRDMSETQRRAFDKACSLLRNNFDGCVLAVATRNQEGSDPTTVSTFAVNEKQLAPTITLKQMTDCVVGLLNKVSGYNRQFNQ